MVGLEVEVNGVVIGRVAAALDAVLGSLVVGDVVALRVVEAGYVAEGRERPLELKRRGQKKRTGLPRFVPLEVGEILRWADAHFARTGEWATKQMRGVVVEAPGERWSGVDAALRSGARGVPGGSSLVRLARR